MQKGAEKINHEKKQIVRTGVHNFYTNFQINLDRKFTWVIIILILWQHGEKKGTVP